MRESSAVAHTAAAPVPLSRPIRSRAWVPAGIVFLVYGIWIAQYLGQGHDPRDFIRISATKLHHAHSSTVITYDPHYRYPLPRQDYDGQYYYFIALDPTHAADYVDEPSTRYERILYPLTARYLAATQPSLIPYTLILVNWMFLALGTWFVALWLVARRISPWYALIYGFYAGLFLGLNRDLTDPMAYGLVALAVLLFDRGGRRNRLLAALAFAAAAFTRETTIIFAAVYGISLAVRSDRWRLGERFPILQANAFLAIAIAPFVLFAAILNARFGVNQNTQDALPQLIPFGGLLTYWPWNASRVIEVITVVLPALLCSAVAGLAILRRVGSPAIAALLLNVLLFVVFASNATDFHYTAMGRYSEGVMLAAIYSLPVCDAVLRGRRWWLLTSAIGWLLLTPVQLLAYTIGPLVAR